MEMIPNQPLPPFLSYSHTDLAAANQLRSLLAQAGIHLFQDVATLRPGGRWMSQIQDALAGCCAFIVLVGCDGVERWVEAEVQAALNLHHAPRDKNAHRLPIHPILLPDGSAEMLPPFLALFQAVRWTPGTPLAVDLCDALRLGIQRHRIHRIFEDCPFPGLDAFKQNEAALFFGRRAETMQALACLGNQSRSDLFDPEKDESTANGCNRWLQIEGNSGSGKSSLVMAGLLPMIERGALWPRTGLSKWKLLGPMLPGRDPVARLAEALEHGLKADRHKRDTLSRVRQLTADERALAFAIHDAKESDTGYLLVVDQFEELFTLGDEVMHRTFDALLATALLDPDCPLFVVSTVRADFLDRFDQLPRLSTVYNDRCKRYFLSTITSEGLREAIELPAQLSELDVSEVTTAMLVEARDEPGALPLVANALMQLWHPPRPAKLCGAEFHARGGLAGMLSTSADDLLARIDAEVPKGKTAALELLLRLTRISPDRRYTRQRISRAEAVQAAGRGNDALGERVLDLLSGERAVDRPGGVRGHGMRLVTTGVEGGAPYVDLVHETLLRGRRLATNPSDAKIEPYWPTLYAYVTANRNRDLVRQQLALQAEHWKSRSPLTRWAHLASLVELMRYRSLRPVRGSIERQFLTHSKRMAGTTGLVLSVILAALLESAWWVSVNRLPLDYMFIQPLWYLGWLPEPAVEAIPGGHFTMGCKEGRDTAVGEKCKVASREMDVERFLMGKYSVTFLEYDRYIWANGGKWKAPELYPSDAGFGRSDRPVINVNWKDASAYVRWLGKATGKQDYRLPSEAEWEYAARGGKNNTRYPWGNESPEIRKSANCGTCMSEDAGKRTAPVDSFEANPFGLFNMAGNVWQWVSDVPRLDQDNVRFIRGGSWNNPATNLILSRKNSVIPDRRNRYIGFRVSRSTSHQSYGLTDIPIYKPTLWSSADLTSAQSNALKYLSFSLSMCETSVRCATWTFHGRHGKGEWSTGEVAELTVEMFDGDQVTVSRRDIGGPTIGLNAIYVGTRANDRIVGTFQVMESRSGTAKPIQWTAKLAPIVPSLPKTMRSCITPEYAFCWTYHWNGREYDTISETDASVTRTGVVKVLNFSQDNVITWSELPNGYWSINKGKISTEGQRIMDGTNYDSNGTNGTFMAVWGDAIEELPLSPKKARFLGTADLKECFSWFTGVICN